MDSIVLTKVNLFITFLFLSGLITYSQVYVSSPRIEKLNSWAVKGANVSTNNGEVAEMADIIFLSVKPHCLAPAIAGIYDSGRAHKVINKLFVSILAGVTLESLENVT